MKKVLRVWIFALLCLAALPATFADDAKKSFALGGSVYVQMPVGQYRGLSSFAGGGGLDMEYILPFSLPVELGLSLRLRGGVALSNLQGLSNIWQAGAMGGFFVSLPLGKGFSFQAEIDYGLYLQAFTLHNASINSSRKAVYADQVLEIAPAFCWNNNAIKLELAPLYSLVPQKTGVLQLLGLRFAVLYLF